tara:strand:- start:10649 stop:11422 length:774 start_codon:yes stop_codon:yes gene_type:complete
MFNLLPKIDFSFLLTLGICLLIGAAIFYYCYIRLNVLEESVISQGKILQSFISGQVNLIPNTKPNPSCIDSKNLETNDKIDISDDDSDDSNIDNDSNIDHDDESESNNEKVYNLDNNEDNDSDSNSDNDEDINNLKIASDDITSISILNLDSDKTNINILDNILNIEKVNSNNDLETSLEKNETIKIVDIAKEETNNEINENEDNKKKKSLQKMNIKELQDLIVKKNLGNSNDISKLKKSDLLDIIQKESLSTIEQQ